MTQPSVFGDFQSSIYQRGVDGITPSLPMRIEDLEQLAKDRISKEAYAYIAGGAGSEVTMRHNLTAFDDWRIVPRHLRNVEQRDLSIRLFNTEMAAPLALAPIGVSTLAHPDGSLAIARAAASLNVPMTFSCASANSPEDVAAASGDGPRWFQLYWPRDRDIARSFLQRAESVGYSAIIVTLDTRILAWRERDLELAFLPFLKGEGLGIYLSDPVFRSRLEKTPEEDPATAIATWAAGFSDLSHTWDDIAFLKDCTSLPIVLKGILHPDDARLAIEHGADGMIVSNHGGRQVDGSITALHALPAVIEAVADRVPVLFDSGIRRGADIVKALALGAQAVLVGRPYMWGLATDGEDGVREVIQRLLSDFDITLSNAGYCRPGELNRESLVRQPRT